MRQVDMDHVRLLLKKLAANDRFDHLIERLTELSNEEFNEFIQIFAYFCTPEHIELFISGTRPAGARIRFAEEYADQRVEQYKALRNRKSSPETIRRNVEICDLRKQNRRKWSLSQLAKHFKKSQRTITLVLSEEAKWRNLLSELPGSE